MCQVVVHEQVLLLLLASNDFLGQCVWDARLLGEVDDFGVLGPELQDFAEVIEGTLLLLVIVLLEILLKLLLTFESLDLLLQLLLLEQLLLSRGDPALFVNRQSGGANDVLNASNFEILLRKSLVLQLVNHLLGLLLALFLLRLVLIVGADRVLNHQVVLDIHLLEERVIVVEILDLGEVDVFAFRLEFALVCSDLLDL